jgi:hypothetical protein
LSTPINNAALIIDAKTRNESFIVQSPLRIAAPLPGGAG